MKSGVYQIKNIKTGKFYIGSASNIRTRWNGHRHALNHNKHHAIYLQRSYNKHGIDSFEFSVLEYCEPVKKILLETEQKYIDLLNPVYNSVKIAGSNKGVVRSEEWRVKQSLAQSGKVPTLETRRKISIANTGIKRSQETIDKLKLVRKGLKYSQEEKDHIYSHKYKSVYKIDAITNSIIEEYSSLKQAELATGALISNISRVIAGKSKTSGGFIWKLKNEIQCR